MNYYSNKQKNAVLAKQHTREMATLYASEISQCIRQTATHSLSEIAEHTCENRKMPKLSFLNTDSVSAIMVASTQGEQAGRIAVLNFASYKHPGGMFLNGSMAQEEALCHKSFLFNVLKEFDDSYYAWNRSHLNKGLYLHRALYTPHVVFVNDECQAACDVITCAAPNKSLIRYGNFTDKDNYDQLHQRTQFLKSIAENHNVDTLILGAWGCGVFKQDPKDVLECILNVFAYTSISNIVLAVPGNDENAKVFANTQGRK
jgi:uncharacterized protein (TIGR02452 family)